MTLSVENSIIFSSHLKNKKLLADFLRNKSFTKLYIVQKGQENGSLLRVKNHSLKFDDLNTKLWNSNGYNDLCFEIDKNIIDNITFAPLKTVNSQNWQLILENDDNIQVIHLKQTHENDPRLHIPINELPPNHKAPSFIQNNFTVAPQCKMPLDQLIDTQGAQYIYLRFKRNTVHFIVNDTLLSEENCLTGNKDYASFIFDPQKIKDISIIAGKHFVQELQLITNVQSPAISYSYQFQKTKDLPYIKENEKGEMDFFIFLMDDTNSFSMKEITFNDLQTLPKYYQKIAAESLYIATENILRTKESYHYSVIEKALALQNNLDSFLTKSFSTKAKLKTKLIAQTDYAKIPFEEIIHYNGNHKIYAISNLNERHAQAYHFTRRVYHNNFEFYEATLYGDIKIRQQYRNLGINKNFPKQNLNILQNKIIDNSLKKSKEEFNKKFIHDPTIYAIDQNIKQDIKLTLKGSNQSNKWHFFQEDKRGNMSHVSDSVTHIKVNKNLPITVLFEGNKKPIAQLYYFELNEKGYSTAAQTLSQILREPYGFHRFDKIERIRIGFEAIYKNKDSYPLSQKNALITLKNKIDKEINNTSFVYEYSPVSHLLEEKKQCLAVINEIEVKLKSHDIAKTSFIYDNHEGPIASGSSFDSPRPLTEQQDLKKHLHSAKTTLHHIRTDLIKKCRYNIMQSLRDGYLKPRDAQKACQQFGLTFKH